MSWRPRRPFLSHTTRCRSAAAASPTPQPLSQTRRTRMSRSPQIVQRSCLCARPRTTAPRALRYRSRCCAPQPETCGLIQNHVAALPPVIASHAYMHSLRARSRLLRALSRAPSAHPRRCSRRPSAATILPPLSPGTADSLRRYPPRWMGTDLRTPCVSSMSKSQRKRVATR